MESTMTSDPRAPTPLLILGPAEIDRLPWAAVPGWPGVRVVELWRSGDEHHALISYGPGAGTPGDPHPGADHHIWVVAGSATIAGRRVHAGYYAYVPPATAHPIGDVGPEGCTLLQIHRPLRASA